MRRGVCWRLASWKANPMTDAVKMAKEALRWIVEREKSASSAAALEMARAATDAIDKIAALEQAGEPVAVGVAGEMPGSNGGFSTAVFKASDVPIGASLYAQPPLPTLQRLGQEFDAGEEAIERVARAIDPSDWANIDHWWGYKGTANFDSRIDDMRNASMARAREAIAAMTPQSRGQAFDGEGEGDYAAALEELDRESRCAHARGEDGKRVGMAVLRKHFGAAQAFRDDQVEVIATAFAKAFYGPGFDPFQNPEAYDMAEKATREVLAALSSAKRGEEG